MLGVAPSPAATESLNAEDESTVDALATNAFNEVPQQNIGYFGAPCIQVNMGNISSTDSFSRPDFEPCAVPDPIISISQSATHYVPVPAATDGYLTRGISAVSAFFLPFSTTATAAS